MKRLGVLTLVLLAACSSGSSGGGSAPKDEGPVDAATTAAQIGCTSFEADAAGDREFFVADSGTCNLDGHATNVYRFSNNDTRDKWIDVAKGNGIGRFVVFERGVVTSDDQSVADTVKAKVGGEIRTS